MLGWHTMCLASATFSTGDYMFIDMGVTDNFTDINSVCFIGLLDHHVDTNIIVESGNEVPYQVAAFAVLP